MSTPTTQAPVVPTATERAMLRLLARSAPRSVWEFGSSNVHRMRRAGFVTTKEGTITVTLAGRVEAEKVGG